MKLPIEQMSEARASREVRAGPLTGWLAALGRGGGAACAATTGAWIVVPPEDVATTTGTGGGPAGTMKNCWQVGHLIWLPA